MLLLGKFGKHQELLSKHASLLLQIKMPQIHKISPYKCSLNPQYVCFPLPFIKLVLAPWHSKLSLHLWHQHSNGHWLTSTVPCLWSGKQQGQFKYLYPCNHLEDTATVTNWEANQQIKELSVSSFYNSCFK